MYQPRLRVYMKMRERHMRLRQLADPCQYPWKNSDPSVLLSERAVQGASYGIVPSGAAQAFLPDRLYVGKSDLSRPRGIGGRVADCVADFLVRDAVVMQILIPAAVR